MNKEEKNTQSSNKTAVSYYEQIKRIFKIVQPTLQLLVNLSIIAGVVFAFMQVGDYRIRTSADLVLKFGEYLDDEPYLEISQALDTENKTVKIFKPEGPFSIRDIDRYLGTFETLGSMYKKGLITCGMFKIDFVYYIKKAYINDEIRDYINDVDAGGRKLWPNLVFLGDIFVYGKNIDCSE